jgi:hypothetical protein
MHKPFCFVYRIENLSYFCYGTTVSEARHNAIKDYLVGFKNIEYRSVRYEVEASVVKEVSLALGTVHLNRYEYLLSLLDTATLTQACLEELNTLTIILKELQCS